MITLFFFSFARPYSTLNLQFAVDDIEISRILVLVRHTKLPTYKDCDVLRVLKNVRLRDGEFRGCKREEDRSSLWKVSSLRRLRRHVHQEGGHQ